MTYSVEDAEFIVGMIFSLPLIHILARFATWLALVSLVLLTASCMIGRQRIVPRITRRAPPMVSFDNTGAGAIDSEPNPVTRDDNPFFLMVRGTW